MGVIAGLLGALTLVWNTVVVGVSGLASVLGSLAPAAVPVLFSSVWAVVLGVGLVAMAAVFNLAGVDDVHGALNDRLFDGEESGARPTVEEVLELPKDAVTDDAGRFSKRAFETATGLSPPEFIHLFVQVNGGRIDQSTISRCLPWSKATTSRYLDELEAGGLVTRIPAGKRNVVCTPDAVPEGHRE